MRLSEEVKKLESEIEEIVLTYTRMAEEKFRNINALNESYTVLTTKRDQVFGKKCQNLERENMNLNERIRMLTAEIDDIRLNTSLANKNQTVVQPGVSQMSTIRSNNLLGRNDFTSFDNVLEQITESRVT